MFDPRERACVAPGVRSPEGPKDVSPKRKGAESQVLNMDQPGVRCWDAIHPIHDGPWDWKSMPIKPDPPGTTPGLIGIWPSHGPSCMHEVGVSSEHHLHGRMVVNPHHTTQLVTTSTTSSKSSKLGWSKPGPNQTVRDVSPVTCRLGLQLAPYWFSIAEQFLVGSGVPCGHRSRLLRPRSVFQPERWARPLGR